MIKFTDKAQIGKRSTKDGYLVAMSKVARTGVQDYLAAELGLPGDGVVRVNRPESEVFAKDAMASLTHAPVTINHPAEMVDADNWKDLAVGEVGEGVLRDGEWLAVPLIVKDAKGIDAAGSTHQEISMGYTAELKDAPAGADYDLEMTSIRFNHLALVPKGRAGAEARIGDGAVNWGAAPQQLEDHSMTTKAIVVGDEAVNVPADVADKITAALDAAKKEVEAKDADIVDRDKAIAEHMAEIANLKQSAMTDADVLVKAKELNAVAFKAAKFIDGFEAGDKDADQIKREVLGTVYDADKVADFPEVAVDTMFDNLNPPKVNDAARDAMKKGKSEKSEEDVGDAWGKTLKKMKGEK